MYDKYLRYQPVLTSNGTVAIHELVVDREGTVTGFSYSPITIECDTVGDIAAMLKHIYRDLRLYQPIPEEELESMFRYVPQDSDEDEEDYEHNDNVIDLVEFLANRS